MHTKRSVLLNTADGTYLLAGITKPVLASEILCQLPLLPSAVRFHCLEQGKFTPFCGWHLDNQGTVEEIVVVEKILVFCSCRIAEDKRMKMVQCSTCKGWFLPEDTICCVQKQRAFCGHSVSDGFLLAPP